MKKMTKKIVAIVTMMMFIVTMLPFAAFAAVNQPGDVEHSKIVINGADEDNTVYATVGEELTATLEIRDKNGEGIVGAKHYLTGVKLAAIKDTDKTDVISKVLDVDSVESTLYDNTINAKVTNFVGIGDGYVLGDETTKIGDLSTVTFKFTKEGTYYLTGLSTEPAGKIAPSAQKVVVSPASVERECTGIQFDAGVDVNDALEVPAGYLYNGVQAITVKATAYEEAEDTTKKPVAGETLEINTSNGDIIVNKDTAVTNANGQINFKVMLANENASGKIYVTCPETGVSNEITVTGKKATAADIKANNTGLYVDYAKVKEDAAAAAYQLTKSVTFDVTDSEGYAVTKKPATLVSGKNSIVVDAQPSGSKLDGDNFSVVWDNTKEAWTLVSNKALKLGDYTVTVALNNGAKATAEFTVGKFDAKTAKLSLVINDGDITDTVNPKAKMTAKVVKVDANGITRDVDDTNVNYAITGKAVARTQKPNVVTVVAGKDNEYIGTEILVQAFDKTTQTQLEQVVTVVAPSVRDTLAFDAEAGDADANNKVTVTVVDENGKLVQVKGVAYAKVTDQSNKDAKVTVTKQFNVKKGVGTLTLYADKATTADIQVVVYSNEENKIIGKTLTYTFGEKDADADKTVVMTIGDSQYVINNKIVTGDAAPYVANSRTYVPIRALAEAFSADVNWDNDARTVTIVRGDKTIVMNADNATYTVNGEEATMDVTPEIKDGRTYVPVRFVAEALGFNVTPLYAADGTTGSVVFQM